MRKVIGPGFVIISAMAATAVMLSFVVCGILKKDASFILQKMSADVALYVVLLLIIMDIYCFINDALVYFSKRYEVPAFGLEFNEIKFSNELDNKNVPISLIGKLTGLYPLTISILSLLFVVALVS